MGFDETRKPDKRMMVVVAVPVTGCMPLKIKLGKITNQPPPIVALTPPPMMAIKNKKKSSR